MGLFLLFLLLLLEFTINYANNIISSVIKLSFKLK